MAIRRLAIGVGVLFGVIVLAVLLQLAGVIHLDVYAVAQGTGFFMLGLALLYFGAVIFLSKLSKVEKKRIAVIFVFFMAAVLFWAGFEQAGSSMNLFAERMTQRVIFGWEMPASFLQAVNSIFIIALAPVFGILWVRLGRKQPSTPAKMGAGLAFLAIGFLVLAWGASFTGGGLRVSMLWLIVTYLLHTVGELCLSPVGLSSVTKLSPRPLVGQMMGTWFMGTALGNLIAGLAAGGFQGMGVEELFLSVAKVTGIAGLILLALAKPIRRFMGALPEEGTAPVIEPKVAPVV
jgi:POT family proton-dependent oligopeptide transporter